MSSKTAGTEEKQLELVHVWVFLGLPSFPCFVWERIYMKLAFPQSTLIDG